MSIHAPSRTIVISRLWLVTIALVGAAMASASPPPPAPATPIAEPVPATPDVIAPSMTSLSPTLTVSGGSEEQRARLDLAVSRFRDAGLVLPDLVVVFASTAEACGGHYGLYRDGLDEITICSDVDFVYEHELAHAYIAHVTTEQQRVAFMAIQGFSAWIDPDLPWNERGVEGAAFVIQQALGGLPLPAVPSAEHHERAAAFAALTGVADPRIEASSTTVAGPR